MWERARSTRSSTAREVRGYELVGGVGLPGDARHAEALEVLARVGSGEQVLTTNLVLGEAWTFLRRKDSHRTAVGSLDRVAVLESARKLVVHAVTGEQESKAWAWLRRRDERE